MLFLAAVVIVPIAEEILFRGMVFNELKVNMHLPAAFVIQSIMFGLYHLNFIQITYTILLGFILTWVCITYNSVLASGYVHIGVNVIAVLSILQWTEVFMKKYGIVVLILGSIAFIGSSILLLKVGRRHSRLNTAL